MSYIFALMLYALSIYIAIRFTSSEWYNENKEKKLNKKHFTLAMIWFLVFLGSQFYIIKEVVDYMWFQ